MVYDLSMPTHFLSVVRSPAKIEISAVLMTRVGGSHGWKKDLDMIQGPSEELEETTHENSFPHYFICSCISK